MRKEKIYRKILLFQVGVLGTLTIHYFATQNRGYFAIGGEFLLIPLLFILCKVGQAIKERWKETERYFERRGM